MISSASLKALEAWAKDRFCERRIVYHHVPKCGGTSISRALRRSYFPSQAGLRPEQMIQAHEAWQRSHENLTTQTADFTEMLLLYLLYSDVRCIAAHAPFSDIGFEKFSQSYAFVTMLRDPVERFISNYFWSSSRPPGERRIDFPLAEYLTTPAAKRLGCTYVRYFCGMPGKAEFDAKDIDRAITNLRRLNYVGFLDELDEFRAALQSLTGRRLRIGTENVLNTASQRNEIMSGPLREKVLAACAADCEVWLAVQDLRPNGQGITR